MVDPAYTSQTCNRCGHVAKENRESQAEFLCVSCGHHENADVNAARNILDRATTVAGMDDAEGVEGRNHPDNSVLSGGPHETPNPCDTHWKHPSSEEESDA